MCLKFPLMATVSASPLRTYNVRNSCPLVEKSTSWMRVKEARSTSQCAMGERLPNSLPAQCGKSRGAKTCNHRTVPRDEVGFASDHLIGPYAKLPSPPFKNSHNTPHRDQQF